MRARQKLYSRRLAPQRMNDFAVDEFSSHNLWSTRSRRSQKPRNLRLLRRRLHWICLAPHANLTLTPPSALPSPLSSPGCASMRLKCNQKYRRSSRRKTSPSSSSTHRRPPRPRPLARVDLAMSFRRSSTRCEGRSPVTTRAGSASKILPELRRPGRR